MTKCYGHEECEYNAQPNCALPNGMECPHGVKADKPAEESGTDIEALIERLNQYSQSLVAYQMGGEFADVCMDAATALSTLRVENEKLRDELDSVKCERDAAIKDLFEIIGDIEEIRCGYGVDNADTDEAFAELCNGYCANAGNLCYEEGEHYRCKHFKWRGPQKED